MTAFDTIHKLVGSADSSNSMAARARRRRWEMFRSQFPEIADMHVLDLGGTTATWESAPVRPEHVTVVNLFEQESGLDWVEPLVANACDLPEDIRSRQFDVVFSNSAFEHLGGHRMRLQFAETVRTIAPHHWVQTPYRYFPIEPHWLFPCFQFLPLRTRVMISRHWSIGHRKSIGKPISDAYEDVLDVELVDVSYLRHCFPQSRILRERFLGLTKSIIVVG